MSDIYFGKEVHFLEGLRKQPWYPLLPLIPIHTLAYICNFINCFYNATPTFFGAGFSLLYVGLCFYLLFRFRQNTFWLKFYAIFSLMFFISLCVSYLEISFGNVDSVALVLSLLFVPAYYGLTGILYLKIMVPCLLLLEGVLCLYFLHKKESI